MGIHIRQNRAVRLHDDNLPIRHADMDKRDGAKAFDDFHGAAVRTRRCQFDMFGTDADRHLCARQNARGRDRHVEGRAVPELDAGARGIATLKDGREEVHGRRADEAGHEQVAGVMV